MKEIKSPKEIATENAILRLVKDIIEKDSLKDDLPLRVYQALITNAEVKSLQDYANNVSIVRIGLNDHGPVHMKKVCYNALKMIGMLHEDGIQTSLEKEQAGTFADSVAALIFASFLHDTGMTIGRKDHELYSGLISYPLITKILEEVLPGDDNITRRTVIRATAMEGILGHMGTHLIHSLEAGLILIADGCDMTKGRARITLEIPSKPEEGDIHKYSANSIEKVRIVKGYKKPIKIEIHMKSEVGFFQVEGVLMPKIKSSTAKHLIELEAGVIGEEMKKYI